MQNWVQFKKAIQKSHSKSNFSWWGKKMKMFFTDILATVRFVSDSQFRYVFVELVNQLFGSEWHSRYIVNSTLQAFIWCSHKFPQRAEKWNESIEFGIALKNCGAELYRCISLDSAISVSSIDLKSGVIMFCFLVFFFLLFYRKQSSMYIMGSRVSGFK